MRAMNHFPDRNGHRRSAGNGDLGTFVALGAIMFLAVGLIVLMAVVLPQMLALSLLPLAFLFLGAFHYVTWGWWMPSLTDEERAELQREAEEEDRRRNSG